METIKPACRQCGCELSGRKLKFCSTKCRKVWYIPRCRELTRMAYYAPKLEQFCKRCGIKMEGRKRKFCHKKCGLKWMWENKPEIIRKASKKWRLNNRDYVYEKKYEYRKKRLQSLQKGHPLKIKESLRRSITQALRGRKCKKRCKTMALIGCTIPQLKHHLESQFKDGMTWNNRGILGWHIDHKRPCASFDLTDREQQKSCFHYSNLQPLWWHENISKSDKMLPEFQWPEQIPILLK